MKSSITMLAILLIGPAAVRGEGLVALTATNQLIRFDSATPGTVSSSVNITGLAAGDSLAGIDKRPANNLLYGFAINGSVGKVYSIDDATGLATLAATLSADAADVTAPFPYAGIDGSFFGVDFNPVADRLRVVSDSGQSLRINVANGFTQLDVSVAYAGGDPQTGTTPQVYASAYTNNFAGAVSTVLYNLDGSIGNLVTQNPPNNGTLNSQGLLTSIAFPDSAFDISGVSGVGYVVLDGLTLGRINLANGTITDVGPIGTNGSFASITGLTVLPVPEPSSVALLALACLCGIAMRRRD